MTDFKKIDKVIEAVGTAKVIAFFDGNGNMLEPYPMIPATPDGEVHMGARLAASFLPGMPPELIEKAYSDWLRSDEGVQS